MNKSTKKKSGRGGWKRGVLVVICVILALILVAIAGAGAYINHLLGRLNSYDPANDSTISSSEADQLLSTDPDLVPIDPTNGETIPHITDVTFPTEVTEPVEQGDHVINILLIGQDRRPGEERQRSDAMILVTFNKSKKTITLTSFMRDQYVQIPGYLPNKMNAAYQWGGMNLLNETLRVNYGVVVDGNAEVDFSSFSELIDLMDGVDINLSQEEADFLNQGRQWNLTAGNTRLTGEQALAYSRIRQLTGWDYKRTERQRQVLMSLIDRYKGQSVTKMITLLEDILPLVTTNMSTGEIIDYAVDLFPMLSSAQINTMRIPVDGTFDEGDVEVREGLANFFQYNIDFEPNREILRELFATNSES